MQNGKRSLSEMEKPKDFLEQHYFFEHGFQSDVSSLDELLTSQPLLLEMLDHSMDGITIITPEYDVIYLNQAMKQWYSVPTKESKPKCYAMFHHAGQVCRNCPAAKCYENGHPNRGTVPYMMEGVQVGYLDNYAVPVLDKDSNTICVIEYTHNISLQMAMEKNLQIIQSKFEILQHQNDILESRLADNIKLLTDMTNYVIENIEKYVKPSLRNLAQGSTGSEAEVVGSVLDTIFEPFEHQRQPGLSMLTAREFQVAALIKEGKTSKEIAAALFVTKKAVDFHRRNIRQKLNLDPHINLQRYLARYF